MRFQIHTVYSADDQGWYAEVYCLKTGKTLYQTKIHPSRRKCHIDAMYWVENEVTRLYVKAEVTK